MTPLGIPVDPLVYMITAISEGAGLLKGLFSALEKTHTPEKFTYITNFFIIMLTQQLLIVLTQRSIK